MFIAYLKQHGEGCNYTIGCGQTLIELPPDINNYAEASYWFKKEYPHFFDNNSEYFLESLRIFKVTDQYNVDIQSISDLINAERLRQKLNKKEAEERALLKKLKEKYEQV